ncbi:hypothetical protein [Paludibacterium denitrificans]|uniref:hypothetical protein n=1 Tax=Paludibacterium denitrificans TaxID=2675226 RepID=UPI001E2DAEE7|nr:hypothetical protein [Paludibacterium denitrificans]
MALCIVTLGTVARYYTLTHFLHDDLGNVVESQQLALASYIAHDIDEKIVQRQTMLTRLATSLPVNLLSEPERLRALVERTLQLPAAILRRVIRGRQKRGGDCRLSGAAAPCAHQLRQP